MMCRGIDTFLAIFKAKTPSLFSVSKQYGLDFTQAYIEGWIVNLREFINVGKKMTDDQTFDTAMMIVDEFHHLTLADINLIFKRAKMGYYGKQYDRLDGQLILSWFQQHYEERFNSAEEIQIYRNSEYKSTGYQERTSEQKNRDFERFQIGEIVRKATEEIKK